MKKGAFAIYCKRDGKEIIETVKGYLLDYGTFRFGIRREGKLWSITEISTGALIGIYAPRKKDVIKVLDENITRLETIQRVLNSNDPEILEIQQKIRDYYTVR